MPSSITQHNWVISPSNKHQMYRVCLGSLTLADELQIEYPEFAEDEQHELRHLLDRLGFPHVRLICETVPALENLVSQVRWYAEFADQTEYAWFKLQSNGH